MRHVRIALALASLTLAASGCFEDVMTFKGHLMQQLQWRNRQAVRAGEVTFTTLEIDSAGVARERQIAVLL